MLLNKKKAGDPGEQMVREKRVIEGRSPVGERGGGVDRVWGKRKIGRGTAKNI